jgi:uncharacterized repeat protein (TIGR01451 family)
MRPAVASRGESISVVLRALNSGPEPVIGTVTDALPAGLVFTEGTLWSSRPTVEWDATSRSIRWTGDIETGEAVEIRFAAEYDSDEPVTNIMVVADEAGTRVASWAAVSPLAARLFVPAAARP